MCQPIRKASTVKIQSMLYRLKRQTDFQTKYFFKVKNTVKDMNDITIDLPKGKNFFAEFVFTIFTLVRKFFRKMFQNWSIKNRNLYFLFKVFQSIFSKIRYFWWSLSNFSSLWSLMYWRNVSEKQQC